MKKEKRILKLDRYEYGMVLRPLNDKRNELIREQRSTDLVDDVLLKMIDAPAKKERQWDERR